MSPLKLKTPLFCWNQGNPVAPNTKFGLKQIRYGRSRIFALDFKLGRNDFEIGQNGQNDLGRNDLFAIL